LFFGTGLGVFVGRTQQLKGQPKFVNYSISEGLPSTETYYTIQDRKGYIWIATDRGVARYDGRKFEVFTVKEGLTDNVVFEMYEDYKGRIWFITYNSKLCYYDLDGKIKPYKYNKIITDFLFPEKVDDKSLFIDTNDVVHIGFKMHGSLIIQKNGKFRIQEGEGIQELKFYRKGDQVYWHSYLNHGYNKKPDIQISYETDKKRIEFGSDYVVGKVSVSASEKWQVASVVDKVYSLKEGKYLGNVDGAISIYVDGDDLWVGSKLGGVKRFNLKNTDFTKGEEYLSGLSISSIFRDREGGYWFTSIENGVYYCPTFAIKNLTTQDGLINSKIIQIQPFKNHVLACYEFGKMECLKHKNCYRKETSVVQNLSLGASQHKLYYSTDHVFRVEGKKNINVSKFWSKDFCEEPHSVLAGYNLLYRFYDDGRTDILIDDRIDLYKGDIVIGFNAIMIDQEKKIWLGTEYGLSYYSKGKSVNGSLRDDRFKRPINDLVVYKPGINIASTNGAGIYFFKNEKIEKQLTQLDGLLSDEVENVFVDEMQRIWCCTNKGLNLVEEDKKGNFKISRFTTDHGLISNEVTSVFVKNDTAWVGTKLGLSIINLKQLRENQKSKESSVYLSSVELDGKAKSIKRTMSFSNNVLMLKVGFRSCHYRSTKNQLFAYRLKETDPWSHTEVPEIFMIRPSAGSYELQIKFKNVDGNWVKQSNILAFDIDLPPYRRWYSILLMVVVGVLGGMGIYRNRLRRIKQKHENSTKIKTLEQKALRAQMNPHFIFNSLNSIQSFLLYEENEKAEKYLLKFANLIRQTLNVSREPSIGISEEIQILNRYLELEQMRFKDKFEYHVISKLSKADLNLHIPNMLIQPFVENAVIHGFAGLESGGELTVTFDKIENKTLTCFIEDNGVGRPKTKKVSDTQHKSFGTLITEERLQAFKEETETDLRVEFEDFVLPKKGTRIKITIPILTYLPQHENDYN
jgi:ligand-binding sensor domain-containing protein